MTFRNVKILIKAVVNKNKNKYYFNIFLEKGSYKDKWIFVYYKCYIMIELTFLKELMLIKQVQKECDICQYWYFLNYSFKFQTNAYNRCRDLLMMSMNLSGIAISDIKGSDYHCIISFISKNEAINLIQNANLTKNSGTL